jgi:hypothetical protein
MSFGSVCFLVRRTLLAAVGLSVSVTVYSLGFTVSFVDF